MVSSVQPADYMQGLRAGIAARLAGEWGLSGILAEAISGGNDAVERGFDALKCLSECAAEDRVPNAEERSRLAECGLLWLGPEKEGFDVRLFPASALLNTHQLRELSAVSQFAANGSVQAGADGSLTLHTVALADAPEAWRRLTAASLHAAASPADGTGNCGPPLRRAGRWLSDEILALAEDCHPGCK